MKLGCIIAIILTMTFSSCSRDWLDVKTSIDISKPESLKDLQALIDNVNSGQNGSINSNSPSLGQISSDDSYITDAAFLVRGDKEKNAYTWSRQTPYLVVVDWISSYEKIFVCNLVLEEVGKIDVNSTNEQSINNITGQALFNRSRVFFELSQIWSPPLTIENSQFALGIPIRLESDINIPSKRSTVKEMYDRIIGDLLLAKNLLPVQAQYKTRASKRAVFALLARVYLNLQMYEDALIYSDSCLKVSGELMDFNQLSAAASFPIPPLGPEIIFWSTLLNSPTSGSSARISSDFRDSYLDGDIRKIAFFGASSGLITFKGNYTGSSLRFSGLATDEQYLIRAECYARANKVSEAMSDLNTLLKSRWNNNFAYVPVAASDAEDALRKVLQERRKELLMRGLRWSDLRRLNQDTLFTTTITRIVDGQTYILEPNSYKYTFPIPDDIIQLSGMPQNQGWE